MLDLHMSAWKMHLKHSAYYTLIDDGSPAPTPTSFQMECLDIYKIEDDIPWNIAGARNLAFHVAKTDWVLCADVDHVVTQDALKTILKLDLTDPNIAYIFNRRTVDGYFGVRGIINILMNKQRYFEMGGHDEDYSGHYGREETFFSHCLKRHGIQVIYCEDIVLEWHPRFGGTKGLPRDKTFNTVIFNKKMVELKNGSYRNGPILRFSWKCVT